MKFLSSFYTAFRNFLMKVRSCLTLANLRTFAFLVLVTVCFGYFIDSSAYLALLGQGWVPFIMWAVATVCSVKLLLFHHLVLPFFRGLWSKA